MGRSRRVWQAVYRRTEVILNSLTRFRFLKLRNNDIEFTCRSYSSNYNPLAGLAELKLGKILPHLNEFQQSLHHIREAGDILKVTHGDQSRVMRDFVRPLLADSQAMLEESQRVTRPPPSDDEDEEEEA